MVPPELSTQSGKDFRKRVSQLGEELNGTISTLLSEIPGSPHSPQKLAQTLGLDKVFTSRLLKAMREHDPLGVVHLMPGPEPLRRLAKSFKRRSCNADQTRKLEVVIDRFDQMIRQEAGDRSSFAALVTSWLPSAKEALELRHRQAAYKAMSLLRGSSVDVNASAVLLNPSEDPGRIDVVWIFGIYGLRRMRPGVVTKFSTRRVVDQNEPRQPLSLDGDPIEDLTSLRLDQFCFSPPAPMEAQTVGESCHYLLGDAGFGPNSAVDLVFAELNRSEIASVLPKGSNRKGWFFSSIGQPSRRLQFDVFVHRDLYRGRDPELIVYDTSVDGVADVNDPVRDVDRIETSAAVEVLGFGDARAHTRDIPNYVQLLEHVYSRLGWNVQEHRGYRCSIDFPIYGSQVSLAFEAPEKAD